MDVNYVLNILMVVLVEVDVDVVAVVSRIEKIAVLAVVVTVGAADIRTVVLEVVAEVDMEIKIMMVMVSEVVMEVVMTVATEAENVAVEEAVAVTDMVEVVIGTGAAVEEVHDFPDLVVAGVTTLLTMISMVLVEEVIDTEADLLDHENHHEMTLLIDLGMVAVMEVVVMAEEEGVLAEVVEEEEEEAEGLHETTNRHILLKYCNLDHYLFATHQLFECKLIH